MIVVTIIVVTFVLVDGDNVDITHVIWFVSILSIEAHGSSFSCCSSADFPLFWTSGVILSFPGAFLQVRQLMVLLSSSNSWHCI